MLCGPDAYFISLIIDAWYLEYVETVDVIQVLKTSL